MRLIQEARAAVMQKRRLTEVEVGALAVCVVVGVALFIYAAPGRSTAPAKPQSNKDVPSSRLQQLLCGAPAPPSDRSAAVAPSAPAEPKVETEQEKMARLAKAWDDAAAGKVPAEQIPYDTARQALATVGMDPAAEVTWMQAINDMRHTPKAREDLIEDLNEVGFADRKQLTTADLPMIENRIKLIEFLGPKATDQQNIRS